MPTLSTQAQVSYNELLKAVGQLNPPDLERFVAEALRLQAAQKAPSLSKSESELLMKINQQIPAAMSQRYAELISKRRAETLTSDEYAELLAVGERIEQLETQRMEALAELARLRKTTLTALMKNLGIRTPDYA